VQLANWKLKGNTINLNRKISATWVAGKR